MDRIQTFLQEMLDSRTGSELTQPGVKEIIIDFQECSTRLDKTISILILSFPAFCPRQSLRMTLESEWHGSTAARVQLK